MSDATGPVTFTLDGEVAVIRIDDGKANALGHETLDAIGAALDRAEAEAQAVVLVGREGRFSAGFDLKTMTAGPDSMLPLLTKGAELSFRLLQFPLPTVIACTGHALAMGAILLMSADVRIGTDGPFKIGMNEVAIGMPIPKFAMELARDRLAPTHFVRAIQLATVYDPTGAVVTGYLDEVVADGAAAEAAAIDQARTLATGLRSGAFRLTRHIMRESLVQTLRHGLAWDLTTFTVEA
jgi:enoyl-CoA hydratase